MLVDPAQGSAARNSKMADADFDLAGRNPNLADVALNSVEPCLEVSDLCRPTCFVGLCFASYDDPTPAKAGEPKSETATWQSRRDNVLPQVSGR